MRETVRTRLACSWHAVAHLLGGLAVAGIAGTTAAFAQTRETATASPAVALHAEAAPFFAEHCTLCHGNRLSTVNLNLEALAARLDPRARSAGPDAAGRADRAGDLQVETWTRVLGKLNAGQMPPPGRPRPADDALARLTASIEAYLADAGYRRTPDPGRVTARRLNRVEYDNTVRSLLGVHGSPADEFPIDDSGYGFDNIGDVLSVSPLLMEKYVAAAKRLSPSRGLRRAAARRADAPRPLPGQALARRRQRPERCEHPPLLDCGGRSTARTSSRGTPSTSSASAPPTTATAGAASSRAG